MAREKKVKQARVWITREQALEFHGLEGRLAKYQEALDELAGHHTQIAKANHAMIEERRLIVAELGQHRAATEKLVAAKDRSEETIAILVRQADAATRAAGHLSQKLEESQRNGEQPAR